MEQSWSVKDLTEFVAQSVRDAREGSAPFYHLQFTQIFPPDFYAEMLRTMPDDNDYRPMSGKSKMGSTRPDGKPTRTKIDLFPEGRKPKVTQMPFAPNSGYAFAVWNDTWHSADPVGPEVKTRDSILLTYFVDRGSWRKLRNRARRIGNFLLNEARNLKRG